MDDIRVFSTGSKWAYEINGQQIDGFNTKDEAEAAALKAFVKPRVKIKPEPKAEVPHEILILPPLDL